MTVRAIRTKPRTTAKRSGIVNRPLPDKRVATFFDPNEERAATDRYNATRRAYAAIWASMRP